MTLQRPYPPLTAEQQRLVAQWLPFAHGLAIKFLVRRPHLRHVEDDIFAAARAAGMTAIYKWRPNDGTYASCLAWWVRAALQQVESQEGHRLSRISWETPVVVLASGKVVISHGGGGGAMTLAEAMPTPLPAASHDEEAAVYLARMDAEVPPFLVGHCAAPSIQRFARDGIALWKRWRIGGETQEELAAEVGCTRQAISQRFARVERAINKWAETIRKEAA